MKKLALLLVFLLTFTPFANAESIDIQSMSSEELTALRTAINAELLSRGIEKEVTVPTGRYTVGVDIPSGVYTIKLAGTMGALVSTYTQSGNYDLVYNVTASEPIGKLDLQEGQTIEIAVESVVFTPYSGLGF